MKNLLLTVLAFGLPLSPAFAEDKTPERLREERSHIFGIEGLQKHQITRVVPSGAKQHIGFFNALNPDCTASGDVSIRILKGPEHGAVDMTTTTDFPHYPPPRPAAVGGTSDPVSKRKTSKSDSSALYRMFRRFSAAVATSREGHQQPRSGHEVRSGGS
jgi:hypothetical protein